MSIGKVLGEIVGSGAGTLAKDLADVIDTFVQTKEEKEAAAQLLMKIQQEPDRWQAEINKIEAGHRTIFVSGWRPAIGWICAFALGWGWILAPIAEVVLKGFAIDIEMPAIEMGQAISLVMAMLGMGGLRTYEKLMGKAK